MNAPGVCLVDFDSARTNEVVQMWRESFEFGVGIIDPHPIAAQREFFVESIVPVNSVRLALSGERLVGFIAATKESIAQLHVRTGHHRVGIGSRLLDWAKDQSGGTLWLYTFARNSGARAFYERHGFNIVARGFEPTWQLEDIKYQWVARLS